MLGKRCRTIQRTASISQNMGPHYLYHNYNCNHDTTANYAAKQNAEKLSLPSNAAIVPQVPANIPQIIGFNPMIKSTGAGGGGAGACMRNQSPHSKFVRPAPDQSPKIMYVARPFPHDMDDDDPARANNQLQHIPPGGGAGAGGGGMSSKRSQITPISALQTLLAAARQISYTSTIDQTPAFNSYSSRNEDSKSCMKAGSASPSCATPSSRSAKQGLWQGFSALNEVKSKEINNKHTIVATPEVTKPGPELYCNNVSVSDADFEHLFYVEGTSSLAAVDDIGGQIGSESADQNPHALYLATSPLTPDFTPNSVPLASFLESCFLCKRPLGQGRDIFMYRGERAFCSVECRDKQMRVEERKEKLRHMQSKMNSNVQQQELYTNTNTTSSSNNAPHPQHQHHKHHHHHHQYGSQAYNNKQHRTSLLMPAA